MSNANGSFDERVVGQRVPKYLVSCLVARDQDLEELARWQSHAVGPTRVFFDPSCPPSVQICRAGAPGLIIDYVEVVGNYVRHATYAGADVGVTLILEGRHWTRSDQVSWELGPGEGALRMPGEATVQAAESVSGFALRFSLDDATRFRLRALPHRHHRRIERRLSRADAGDLIRVVQFYCLEHERLVARGRDQSSPQLELLLHAISVRFNRIVAEHVALPKEADEEMLRICRLANREISRSPHVRHPAEDLAAAALCSVRQLYRAFSTVADLTPLEYQSRTRLQGVRQAILADLDAPPPMTEVAERFGYRTRAAMVKPYREEYGETPDETLEVFRSLLAELKRGRFGPVGTRPTGPEQRLKG